MSGKTVDKSKPKYKSKFEKTTKIKKKMETENCPLCCEILTIKNAVNPQCGHTHCSTCFWKWAKKSDACPFCRGVLIPRNREKELEMENLLERRDE